MSLSAWITCIQTAGSSCTLDNGTYTGTDITAIYPTSRMPITIANGVTAAGAGTNEYATSLQLPSAYSGKFLYVASGTSVTIQNLTIDGNRYSFPNAQTGCGPRGSYACGNSSGYGCTAANTGDAEIYADGQLNVNTVAFWNSPDLSVYMSNGTLYYASVYYARSTGAWIYNGGSSSTVSNGYFEHNGTAGLRLSGSGGTNLFYTTFDYNRYEMPDGSGGGQLYIDYNAANNTVELNTINGENWSTTPNTTINNCNSPPIASQGVAGIEIEPSSSNNSIRANEVLNNTGDGISVHGVSSLTISGYYPSYPYNARYIHNNTGSPDGYYSNGILFAGGNSSNVTLDGILSRLNDGYAVDFTQYTTGTGWLNSHCLGSNYESSPYWTNNSNDGLTNHTPSNTTTCP